jgi:hypothetical protein
MSAQDRGPPSFDESGIKVYFKTDSKVDTAYDGEALVASFSVTWTEDQIKSVCKIVRKNVVRAWEDGSAQGELDQVNRMRDAFWLDRLGLTV